MGNNLYAGGWFYTAGGTSAWYIATWNGNVWGALGWGVGSSTVRALAVSGSDLYAGGSSYVARWNGSSWSAVGSGMSGWVNALAASGSDLYAGGEFVFATNSGGIAITANRIAKWNGTSWSAFGSGIDNTVHALAVSGSNLYAGGFFTWAGGTAANFVARWNGNIWSALGSGMNGSVYALAVSGSNLYAGGNFTRAGGTTVNRIARWNGSVWNALGAGMNDSVRALSVSGGDLYAGGDFTTAGDTTNANRIAKLNGGVWRALGAGMDGSVRALAVAGSDIYAGGTFTWVTNAGAVPIPATRVAKWNGSAWTALGSGLSFTLHAFAISGSDVYAGGQFTIAGGKVSAYAAKWAPLAFKADSATVSNGTFQALLTGPDTNSVVVDSTADFTNWTPVATNTLPPGGAWPLSIPIGTNLHQTYRARLGP